MLDALRNHASQVRHNPRLHADVREFASLLASETLRLDSLYKAYKTERGLVDFTDLEILSLELLGDESLAARLTEDFDLILVDEFQDTNPLQLAIFQLLRRIAAHSRWVGDPKQAIYGFRDTDPELVNRIWKNTPDATRTELPNNYRSQRGLVQIVGTLFAPVFGKDARQEPQNPYMPRGVERWIFDTRNQPEDATALACGIAKLHSEGIRFGDILILERTNRLLPTIATAFDALRIPYLLESPGLLSTREGAMVLAGLRLVSDRGDSLAAATVLHILGNPEQDTPDWIAERLQDLKDRTISDESEMPSTFTMPWEGDARLLHIEHIDRTLLSPTLVAQQVIEALDLPTLVHKWGDPARRCSNLDSILRHTREYEEIAFDSGQAATLNGLILYLEGLAADTRDLRYPPLGHDGVTLMTYHSAKGLEWPVVVLSGLDSGRSPNMWSPAVTGGANTDEDPLAGRTLRSWTWPFGQTDGPWRGLRVGSSLEDDALISAEGVERTAREDDENMRLLYVGCTRAKQKLVFAHRDGKYAWLKRLDNIDVLLNPRLGDGEHNMDGIDTTFVLRRFGADNVDDFRIPSMQKERWIALLPSSNGFDYVERFHSPSQAGFPADGESFDVAELPGPSYFPTGADESQYSAIGHSVHSYFAAIPSMRSLTDSDKLRIAERCLAAFSVSGMLDPSSLVAAGNRFVQWVESVYPESLWRTEVPVNGARTAGGSWLGTIDLALQLPNGDLVIVDHKSAPIRREYCASKAAEFAGQLDAYTDVLKSAGTSIKEAWIHFPLAGVIAKRNMLVQLSGTGCICHETLVY
jgi:superfamily I DNA/RNA helicase